jgi:hypothetical protein
MAYYNHAYDSRHVSFNITIGENEAKKILKG